MLDVIFRKRAKTDLLEIEQWFANVAPESVERILDDIYRSVEHLREQPESAPMAPGRKWRRKVTRKFHFKIAYVVKVGVIEVLGVYRHQNREK